MNARDRAAGAAWPGSATATLRLAVALLFALFGFLAVAQAASDERLAGIAVPCSVTADCGLPADQPAPATKIVGFLALGDGSEPHPSALSPDFRYRVPLPEVSAAGFAIVRASSVPEGRRFRLVDSRAPPRR